MTKLTRDDFTGFYVDNKGDLYCQAYTNKMARFPDGELYSIFNQTDPLRQLNETIFITQDDGSKPYQIVS